MRKNYFFFKSLLLATVLLLGSANAWADGSKRIIDAQNYESVDVADWTSPNGTVTLQTGDAVHGKYAQVDVSGNGNRSAYKTVSYAYEPNAYTSSDMTVEGYVIEFDLRMVGGRQNNRSVAQFVVPTTGPNLATNAPYTGSDYIFSLSQPTNTTGAVEKTWYINDLNNESNKITLEDAWYHYTLIVTASSVGFTITKEGDENPIAMGSKTVSTLPTITGFFGLVGRTYGRFAFDNLEIYDYVAEEIVTSPTINAPIYVGENRIVSISDGVSSEANEVTTYYTLDGTDPTSESDEYVDELTITSDCTIKAISISSTDVSSAISSLEVTVGKVSLATPTISATGFTNASGQSVYNPTFTFECDNSGVIGNPTATLYYTFTPEGGEESAMIQGASFTPSAKGTLKVIASNKDYLSSEKSLVVSSLYTISYTGRDYSTASHEDFGTNWAAAADVNWSGWADGLTYYLSVDAISNDNHLNIQNPSTISLVEGWGLIRGDQKSYPYRARYANEGDFIALKENSSRGYNANETTYQTVYCDHGTGVITDLINIQVPGGYLVQQLYHYTAASTKINIITKAAGKGFATLYSEYALDFANATPSGLSAYTATYDSEKGELNLKKVNHVPAETGVILMSADGTQNISYIIPVLTSSGTDKGDLTGNVASATNYAAFSEYDLYGLVLNGEGNAEFAKITGGDIPAGKAFLKVEKDVIETAKVLRVVVDGQASDVTAPKVAEAEEGEEILVNLAGIPVGKDFKGVVINQKGEKRLQR